MASVSDTDRLTTLYKRAQGFANLNTDYALNQERVVSRPAVVADRVFTDPVPVNAPLEGATPAQLTQDTAWLAANGQRWTSVANPHLVLYKNVPLISSLDNPNKTFTATVGGVNYLVNALLPRVSDATTQQYAIVVTGADVISQKDYILDRDAGLIMIFDSAVNNGSATPAITFWRYEGRSLADGAITRSALIGASNDAGVLRIVNQNGEVFMQPARDDVGWSSAPLNITDMYATRTFLRIAPDSAAVYVAGGDATTGSTIKYSYDGLTWFNATSGAFTIACRGVAYSPSLDIWVAVGNGNATIKYSADGKSWINGSGSVFSSVGYSVTWANDRFIASGNGSVKYSTDGITWTAPATPPPGFTSGYSTAYSSSLNRWIAIGSVSSGSTIAYSNDNGVTWSSAGVANYFSVGGWSGAVWGVNKFVAVSSDSGGNTIKYSSDGLTWYNVTNPFTSSGKSITWTGLEYVAVGSDTASNGAKIKWSADGVSWTNATSGGFTGVGQGIHWNSGLYRLVAVGVDADGSATIKVSYDRGRNWFNSTSNAFGSAGGSNGGNAIGSTNTGSLADTTLYGSAHITAPGSTTTSVYNVNKTDDTIVLDSGGTAYNGSAASILFKAGAPDYPLARIAAVDMAANGSAYKGDLVFQTGLNTRLAESMRITSAGKVGIVSGGSISTSAFGTDYDTLTLNSGKDPYDSSGIASLLFRGVNGVMPYARIAGVDVSPLNGEFRSDLAFQTGRSGNLVDAMHITYDGKIGIGTATPGANLDVKGDIRMSSNIYNATYFPQNPLEQRIVLFNQTFSGLRGYYYYPTGGPDSTVTGTSNKVTFSLAQFGDIKNFEIDVTGVLGGYKADENNYVYCSINSPSTISLNNNSTFFVLAKGVWADNAVVSANSKFTIVKNVVEGSNTVNRIIHRHKSTAFNATGITPTRNSEIYETGENNTLTLSDPDNLTIAFFQHYDSTSYGVPQNGRALTKVNVRITVTI